MVYHLERNINDQWPTKKNHLGEGVPTPSEGRFCENILSIFDFFKDVPYDASSLKK